MFFQKQLSLSGFAYNYIYASCNYILHAFECIRTWVQGIYDIVEKSLYKNSIYIIIYKI